MGDVTSIHHSSVEVALASALQEARDIDASGAIVILIHGDDLIQVIQDKGYRFAKVAGFLEAAKGNALAEVLNQWGGDDEPA